MSLNSELDVGKKLASSLYFTDDSRCDGEMTVEMEPSDSTLIVCKQKVSLHDASGNLIECGKIDNRFDVEKKDIQKLPLSLTRQIILNKKSEYLRDDILCLFCRCTSSIGMFSEIIKDLSFKPVKQVGIKKASDWYECMDRRLTIELTDENRPFKGTGQITLEMRMENFSTASKVTSMFHLEVLDPLFYNVGIFAGDTDGWLAVFPEVKIYQKAENVYFKPKYLWWTASIIDTEGHPRFPQYFEKYPKINDDQTNELREAKYLEKSFILNRADDLLSEDILLLRCDIRFDIDVVQEVWTNNIDKINDIDFVCFIRTIPCKICMDLNRKYAFFVFNLTYQHLHFPRHFRFGIHDISRSINSEPKTDISEFEEFLLSEFADIAPFSWSINLASTEDSTDNMEDIWILDTDPERFLLSTTRRPGNLGRFLIASSPVLRQCINTPMREQGEKRIDLSTVENKIIRMVLYFLQSGRLPKCKFHELVEIYEFSHLYLMENLQLRSSKCMVEGCDDMSLLEEIKGIANCNSDSYLLNLLEKQRRELEHLRGGFETKEHGNPDTMEDKPGSDCYI
ncbi:unnamed protein product [Larinioides sclopetarius]|uniref:BTB/POZ domain-containing protein n=1 Tax=Larinioides sclopetarius TaxID=280406 RepID=A0AAV2B3W7_9ARAC